tara:strand:- start:154 stop:738 length:585 start_codon:yes stop_codon:yes gene_type:complete
MTKSTIKKQKLIYGIGINDANYNVFPKINGVRVMCPFYLAWVNMLKRCYSAPFHKTRPTYIGCTVAKEWTIFSKFRLWMDGQKWQGKHLDKDILFKNNKVYSWLTCIFVTSQINNLLHDNFNLRGAHPRGVSIRSNKYQSQCKIYGKVTHLGYYDTPQEAHEAYKSFKYKHIAEIANQQSEPLRTALLNYVIEG